MRITPEGRERVFSSVLVERIKEDRLGEQIEILLVAWVATGHGLTSPTWEECMVLKKFIDENRDEIAALHAEVRSAMTDKVVTR